MEGEECLWKGDRSKEQRIGQGGSALLVEKCIYYVQERRSERKDRDIEREKRIEKEKEIERHR